MTKPFRYLAIVGPCLISMAFGVASETDWGTIIAILASLLAGVSHILLWEGLI